MHLVHAVVHRRAREQGGADDLHVACVPGSRCAVIKAVGYTTCFFVCWQPAGGYECCFVAGAGTWCVGQQREGLACTGKLQRLQNCLTGRLLCSLG